MAPNLLGSSALFLAEATTSATIGANESNLKSSSYQNNLDAVPSTSKGIPAQNSGPKYRWEIVWRNVIAFVYLHVAAIYGFYMWMVYAKWPTFFFAILLATMGGIGVTAGTHRLWAHRAYKAKWPLRFILMLWQTMAFQNHIYEWVRDHRVHHKFTDSDADPHNAGRGFFFSHIGWLMVKKHRDVIEKGKTVDLSDLEKDWVVMFQKKTYVVIMPILCFVLPTVIPWYFWGEPGWTAWYIGVARYVVGLNGTWCVNSAAHMYGNRPYDKNISPSEHTLTSFITFGEGWHNYHHVFPWDYKAAELGRVYNFTTTFINFFAKIGWAYDMKTVSDEMINKRSKRTGDGTRPCLENVEEMHGHVDYGDQVWGWDDKDMLQEDKDLATILNAEKVE